MNTETRPLEARDLEAAAALAGPRRAEMLAHLRWCLHTIYAHTFVHLAGGQLRGWVSSLAFPGSATIRHLITAGGPRDLMVEYELLRYQQAHHANNGCSTVVYMAPPRKVSFLSSAGFQDREEYLLFQGGQFIQATHEEVELITPAHTLGLLHLDRQVSGQDRAPLLLEHRFAAQAWVQDGKVEGYLLPTLGRGLVVANTPTVGLELQRWLLPHQHEVLVPATNTAACEHLKERGYTGTIFGVRMEYGDPLAVDAQRLFGVGW